MAKMKDIDTEETTMELENPETPVEEVSTEEPVYEMTQAEKNLLKSIKRSAFNKKLTQIISRMNKCRELVNEFYSMPEVQAVEGSELDRRMVIKYFDDAEYQLVVTKDKIVQEERKKIDPFAYKM